MASIDELSKYITGEMRRNVHSPEAKQIAGNLKLSSVGNHVLSLPLSGSSYSIALWRWAGLVGYDGRWDHKGFIKSRYGKWSHDQVTKYEFFLDIWSNIHYGYIGLSIGFSEGVLKSGAGAAQLKNDGYEPAETFGAQCKSSAFEMACLPALDHPHDQAAIQIGCDLWKTRGVNLTDRDVLDIVRSRRAVLNAKRRQL